jgi:murein DD-endopeptidase MepM/ murein hydrolase activator NlpD
MTGRFRSNITVLLLTGLMIIIIKCPSCTESGATVLPVYNPETIHFDSNTPTPDNLPYGFNTAAYETRAGKVRRNQFLSDILEAYEISYKEIDRLIRNSGDVFDVRDIKAGNNYRIYLNKNGSGRAEYMIYEHDLVNHYVLSFSDSLYMRRIEKETIKRLKYSSGIIETSLWEAMTGTDLNPMLAIELSEIYAWSIDFFGLQEGDLFRIIYEEESVDTVSIGIIKIYGACFNHSGEEFFAIPIIQDGKESFYDRDGNSLRKAFLKAPLKFSRISSGYSNNRLHPILRIRRPHHGVDYAAAVGTPVLAIGDGRIITAEYSGANGRIVKIRHNSVYTTAYLHLSRFGKGVGTGKYVKQGDIIGYVGSSGLSTGPHLDFRFYKNGYAVDPLKIKAPPVEPVSEDNLEKFEKISFVVSSLLGTF